ncbi:hypothetical protein ACFL53_00630 [Pseudomonadota bacterium]
MKILQCKIVVRLPKSSIDVMIRFAQKMGSMGYKPEPKSMMNWLKEIPLTIDEKRAGISPPERDLRKAMSHSGCPEVDADIHIESFAVYTITFPVPLQEVKRSYLTQQPWLEQLRR